MFLTRTTGYIYFLHFPHCDIAVFPLQGRNCEYNYDDCLLWPCPDGFTCVDGINSVSCVAVETSVTSAPAVFLTHTEQAEGRQMITVLLGLFFGTVLPGMVVDVVER